MRMTGLFRFALLPDADPAAFELHLANAFDDRAVLGATRITSAFHHQLLASRRVSGNESDNPHPGPQYVWVATVDLVTSAGYAFDEKAARVQELVAPFAVLTGIESFVEVASV
jgi:hypothetical protein